MATTAKTYNISDWKLWSTKPETDSFYLDISKLDVDKLTATAGTWTGSSTEITSIELTEGTEEHDGIYFDPTPTTLQISLRVKNFTLQTIGAYSVGTDIALTLDNPGSDGSATWSVNKTVFFTGKIEQATVSIEPGTDYTIINLQAVSGHKELLNTLIEQTPSGGGNNLDNVRYRLWLVLDFPNLASHLVTNEYERLISGDSDPLVAWPGDNYYGGGFPENETKTLGEWLNLISQTVVQQVYSRIKPFNYYASGADYFINYSPNFNVKTTHSPNGSTFTFDETKIFNIQLGWSGETAPAKLHLTDSLKYFDQPYLEKDFIKNSQAAITSATFEGQSWNFDLMASRIFSFNPIYAPLQIETYTAQNGTSLNFEHLAVPVLGGTATRTQKLYPENIRHVGDTITVNLPDYKIDNVPTIISGRTIQVTPDNWTTTYNLWKGF